MGCRRREGETLVTWSITNWAVAQKWANVPLLTEFNDAVNERLAVTGGTPLPAVTAGQTVQVHSLIESWQAAVEGLLPAFVVSHAAGAPLGAGYYDGTAAAPVYADLAALFSAAFGPSRTTWRAYITRPSLGGADQTRAIAPGDVILGPLFEDLQKTLKALVWTERDLSFSSREGKVGTGYGDPWAAAKAAAEADFAAVPDPAEFATAYTTGNDHAFGDEFWAEMVRVRRRDSVAGLAVGFAHAVDFYARCFGDDPFDDNDDAVHPAAYGLFLVNSSAVTTDAVVVSDWLGSLGVHMHWCAEPVDGPVVLGWVGYFSNAVIRWDVAGGFEYV